MNPLQIQEDQPAVVSLAPTTAGAGGTALAHGAHVTDAAPQDRKVPVRKKATRTVKRQYFSLL